MATSRNDDTIRQQIVLEGGEQIQATLSGIAVAGENAFKTVGEAANKANTQLATIGSIGTRIGAFFGGLGNAFEPAAAALGNLGTAFNGLGHSIGEAGEKLALFIGVGGVGSATGLYQLIKSSADAVVQTENLAHSLGLVTDQLEQLRLVGSQAGVDQDQFSVALSRFAVALGNSREEQAKLTGTIGQGATILRGSVDVASGAVGVLRGGAQKLNDSLAGTVQVFHGARTAALDFSDPFKALGIDTRAYADTAEGTIAVLNEVAKRLSGLGDSSIKASIAQKLFGRGWREDMPVFVELQTRMAAARKTIDEFGIGISEEESRQAHAFRSSLSTMETVVERVKSIVGNTLGQALVPVFDGITAALGRNAGALRAWAQSIVDAVMPVVQDFSKMLQGAADDEIATKWLLDLRDGLMGFKKQLADAIPYVVGFFKVIVATLDAVASAINAVFGTHLNATAIAAIAILGTLTGAFAVLAATLGVVTAALGFLGTIIGGVAAAFGVSAVVVAALGAALVAVAVVVAANWSGMVDFINTAIVGLGQIWTALSQLIADKWNEAMTYVMGVVSSVTQFFANAWNTAVSFVESLWNDLVNWVSGAASQILGFLQPVWNFITAIISGIGNAITAAGNMAGSMPAPTFAGGGAIRGAGSATSDSIWARLSNGEWVMQAAAVRKYGMGFMAAVNSLSLPSGGAFSGLSHALTGGLAPQRTFATGGLAVAGDEPARSGFTLVIDGQTFGGLMAPAEVADRLITFARGRAVRSAGRKPSWAGGG